MRPLLLATSFAALIAASACASARAEAPVAPQPLEVPPVPPRIIIPEIEEVAPPPADPAPAASRPAPRNDPPAKPDTAGTTDPPKTTEPPRQPEAPRVRTPQTANEEAAERDVRAVMGRAQAMLSSVKRENLDRPAQQQHDTARRFLARAEDALRIRNYVFARNLADKAETLARQLGK